MASKTYGWRWLTLAVVVIVAVPTGVLAQPGPSQVQMSPSRVQQVSPQARQVRPAPEARRWNGERDWEHRDWDREWRHDWDRPYWAAPGWWGYQPWYRPYYQPAPVYVPPQWVWNGWAWVWQPGYWGY